MLPEIAFVTVKSVKNPAVSLDPVVPREPVEVILLDPNARVPPIVKPVSVPTLVREEAVTPEARVVPVKDPAGALPPMLRLDAVPVSPVPAPEIEAKDAAPAPEMDH